MSPEVETKPAAPAAPSDISKPEKNTAPASVFDQFRAEVYGSVGAGLKNLSDITSEAGKAIKGSATYQEAGKILDGSEKYLEAGVNKISDTASEAGKIIKGSAAVKEAGKVLDATENKLEAFTDIYKSVFGGVARPAVKGWEKNSSPTPVDDPVGTAKIYRGDTIPTDGTPPLDKSQKLTNGDYDIQMGDGRTVGLHVPPNPNGSVMYVLQGSMNPQFKQEDFAKQTQMNAEADKDGFTVVYVHPTEHNLGQYSKEKAYAYNAPNSLIQDRNLAQAGYNDNVYMDNVRKLLPQIADVDGSAKSTAAIAFSQGTPFLRQYLTMSPNFAGTVGYVGAAFPEGKLAPIAPGNAESTLNVDLLADKSTLPKPGAESLTYRGEAAAHAFADATGTLKQLGDDAVPLSPIRNDLIQDVLPVLKNEAGLDSKAAPPESSQFGDNPGDKKWVFQGSKGTLTEIQLNAPHVYPSASDIVTDGNPAYNAPVSPTFAAMFVENQKK